MMSLDVNGYDNTPEWGYCKTEGCKEEAFPIWLSGDYPDDPDLLLCPKHIGARIKELMDTCIDFELTGRMIEGKKSISSSNALFLRNSMRRVRKVLK